MLSMWLGLRFLIPVEMPNQMVNGTPTALRSVGARYHWRYYVSL
jgi:hypothetical protein